MSSQDFQPQGKAANLSGSKKRIEALGIARGDTAPWLEMQEGIFHQVTVTVEMLVILTRHFAVLAWWARACSTIASLS
jgi:hypothetical protein